MEFAPRTYRMIDHGYVKAVTIETVDSGNLVRLTLEKGVGRNEVVSLDLSKDIAKCIRDHLNAYLDE